MTWYEIGSLSIGALTLVVLYKTWRVVQAYTLETTNLAKCAAEQMPRPCVVVATSRDSSDRAVLEGTSVSLASVSTLRLANVGTGPAVNLHFSARASGSQNSQESTRGPAIGSGDTFDTGYPRNALPQDALIIIEYESVAGSRYRTEARIEDRCWVRSVQFVAA